MRNTSADESDNAARAPCSNSRCFYRLQPGARGFQPSVAARPPSIRSPRYAAVLKSAIVYAAASSMVLYGLARPRAVSSLMNGQAGSISLVRQLNFGLRG